MSKLTRRVALGARLIGAALALVCATTSAQSMKGMGMRHDGAATGASCESSAPLGCAQAATPAFTPQGQLMLAWTQERALYFARSDDLGRTWSLPLRIGDLSKGFDGGADARPQIVADGAGHVLVAYDTFKDDGWDAQIWLVRSSDGGVSFAPPAVFEPGAVSERLPVLDLLPSGRVFMAWQDKRLTKPEHRPGASVAYAWSDASMQFGASAIAAASSCECCRIAVATRPDGTPILAYRAIFAGSVRDHVTQGFLASGAPQIPQRVAVDDWVTSACPHQGPSVAVSANGTIDVVWYTQGTARKGLFYARSTDGRHDFSEPTRLGDADSMASRPFTYARGSDAWRVWKAFDGRVTRLELQQSHDDGAHWSPVVVLSKATGESDHPLLIGNGRNVFVSWLSREHGYQLLPVDVPR